ncbi:hypothetical protein PAXRUDRAFT_181097, partial [Paxillus rubicundulus Ve08.2h10]
MDQHVNGLPFLVDDREWSMEELDDVPPFLWVPQGGNHLTLVDMTGVHLLWVHYCVCPTSQQFHMQLLESGLLSATIDQPKMAFSFSMLNDFIHDNLECGTSASNYYNKLRRITSNVFPHLVPDCYCELLRVSHQWWLLKLLKWAGFGHRQDSQNPGSLVLFCPMCPQPSINVYPDATNDLSNWKYNWTLIMDSNFKVEHLYDRQTDRQVWLMDGLGFMVSRSPYHKYLAATNHSLE